MLLAHQIELRPTVEQADYLRRACGSRRHCFNQLLAHFKQDGVKWSKKEAYQYYIQVIRPQYPWYNDVSSRVTRNAIDDLDAAFKHFFRRVKAGQKPGFPRFKKKDHNESFALREAAKFDVAGRRLRIEKLKARIKLRQRLRFSGIPKQVTICQRARRFFAAILVETQDYDPKDADRQAITGIDFGVKSLATLSNGAVIPAHQKLKDNLRLLAKRQRRLSRKEKGSNRYAKAKRTIQNLHYRVSNQRHAVLHELSDYLTRTFECIVIEDLNVKGMVKNRKLARAIADAGFGTLRQLIEYKAVLRNVTVIVANRWFPSSKRCSGCGTIKKDLTLADRLFVCEACGLRIDRDLNAALNLEQYGLHALTADLKGTHEWSQTVFDRIRVDGVKKPGKPCIDLIRFDKV